MKGLGETSPIPLPGLLNLVIISWFMFGHELHNYLLYFKVFLLSNMSFQSKEDIHFPACTKEVRIFSSLVEPWGRSDKSQTLRTKFTSKSCINVFIVL